MAALQAAAIVLGDVFNPDNWPLLWEGMCRKDSELNSQAL